LRAAAAALASLLAAGPALAEETFDLSAYEKKPLEWKGYFELRPERQFLNRDGAGYLLQFPNGTRSSADRWSAAAELSGILRHDNLSFSFTGHATYLEDVKGSEGDARFYEAYGRRQPDPGVSVDLGKRALGWDKGYAWNAVAFFNRERPDRPRARARGLRDGHRRAGAQLHRRPGADAGTDPGAAADHADLNDDNDNFGAPGHWNPAVKLYGLVRDTDVDFIYAARGSHGPRVGLDLSRNLGINLEVHGEWAHTRDMPRTVLTAGNTFASETRDFTSWLLGLRYLTERDTTWIADVYHNGAGYTEAEMDRFFALAHAASVNPALRPLAGEAAAQGYTQPNAMRDYVYLRVSQKEPFDILYFTPSITLIQNLDDDSCSLSPELLYTGITNLELRLRLFFLSGGRLSDLGKKQNDRRVELRVRYYF
jgi:hypothetical protein